MRPVQNQDSVQEETIALSVEGQSMSVYLTLSGPKDGPRLLLLHGWGSSMEHMKPLMNALSDRFRLLAVDFPGHGQSPVPKTSYGMQGHLDVIRGVVDHLGWTSCGIIGHSNGGRAALAWAANPAAAGRVSFLVLIGPSGIPRKRTSSWYLRTWTARILKAPFALLPPVLRDGGLDWLRHSLLWRMLGSSDYRALDGIMRETFVRTVNYYVTDLLPAIAVPVLVLRGANDEAVTNDQVTKLVNGLPAAGLHTIEGAGHYAQLDRPDVVVAAIDEMASA